MGNFKHSVTTINEPLSQTFRESEQSDSTNFVFQTVGYGILSTLMDDITITVMYLKDM
jgi:hypothetical protein